MSCRQEVWQPRLAVDQLKDAELLEEKLPPAAGRPVDFPFLDFFSFFRGQGDKGSETIARISGGH